MAGDVCRVGRQGAATAAAAAAVLALLVAGEAEHEDGEHRRERVGRFRDERVGAVHHRRDGPPVQTATHTLFLVLLFCIITYYIYFYLFIDFLLNYYYFFFIIIIIILHTVRSARRPHRVTLLSTIVTKLYKSVKWPMLCENN